MTQAPVPKLIITLHLNLIQRLNAETLAGLCDSLLQESEGGLTWFEFEQDEDESGQPYINLIFESAQPVEAWPMVRSRLFDHATFGPQLKRCAVVRCEGDPAQGDVQLYHHS